MQSSDPTASADFVEAGSPPAQRRLDSGATRWGLCASREVGELIHRVDSIQLWRATSLRRSSRPSVAKLSPGRSSFDRHAALAGTHMQPWFAVEDGEQQSPRSRQAGLEHQLWQDHFPAFAAQARLILRLRLRSAPDSDCADGSAGQPHIRRRREAASK